MAHRNQNNSLYLECEFPDKRKRIYVSLIDDSKNIQSVVIQPEWTLRCLLSYVQSSFKIIDAKVSLFTTDKVMIQSLDAIVQNQVLKLVPGVMTPFVSPQIQPKQKSSTNNNNHHEEEDDHNNKMLYDQDYNCNSEFLNTFYQLKIKYKELVQIGESKPYNATFYLASMRDRTNSSAWIVFKNLNGDQFQFTVYSSSDTLAFNIQQCLNNVPISKLPLAISDMMTIYNSYCEKAPGNFTVLPYIRGELVSLFPSHYTHVNSITKSQFILECLGIEQKVCDTLEVRNSLAKKYLLRSRLSANKAIGLIKKFCKDQINMSDIRHMKYIEDCEVGELCCPICLDDQMTIDEIVQLGCGHYLCSNCFSYFIENEIQGGAGNTVSIQCPEPNCTQIIDASTIGAHIQNKHYFNRFKEQMLTDYKLISGSPSCNIKNCSRIILHNPDFEYVIPYCGCSCENNLCYYCGGISAHWPHWCKEQQAMFDEDIETFKYLMETSTMCPQCKYPVQKTIGCNHIRCQVCHIDFCYVCGLKYSNGSHSYCPGGERRKLLLAKGVESSMGIDAAELVLLYQTPNSPYYPIFNSFKDYAKILEHRKGQYKEDLYNHVNRVIILMKQIVEDRMSQKTIKPILEQIQIHINNIYIATTKSKISVAPIEDNIGPKIKTISCKVSCNGVLDQGIDLFVKRNTSEWKVDILESFGLRKKDSEVKFNNHLNKMIIYNRGGQIIKSSKHVLLDEHIFVALNGEVYLEPQEPVIEQSTRQPSSSPKRRNRNGRCSPSPPPSPSSIYQELEDLRSNPMFRDEKLALEDQLSRMEIIKLLSQDFNQLLDQERVEDDDLINSDFNADALTKQQPIQVDQDGWQIYPAAVNNWTPNLSCGLSGNHNHLNDFLDEEFFDHYHPIINRYEKYYDEL